MAGQDKRDGAPIHRVTRDVTYCTQGVRISPVALGACASHNPA
jgi:hypothetical protein